MSTIIIYGYSSCTIYNVTCIMIMPNGNLYYFDVVILVLNSMSIMEMAAGDLCKCIASSTRASSASWFSRSATNQLLCGGAFLPPPPFSFPPITKLIVFCILYLLLASYPSPSLIRYTHVYHVPHAEDMESCRNGEARSR